MGFLERAFCGEPYGHRTLAADAVMIPEFETSPEDLLHLLNES